MVLLLPYLARFLFALSTTDIKGMDGLASDTSTIGLSNISFFSAGSEVDRDVVIEGGNDEHSAVKKPTLGDLVITVWPSVDTECERGV